MAHFSTAWKAFWSILHSDQKAEAWQALYASRQLPQETQPVPQEEPAPQPLNADAQAVHVLALLQREARLVDFIQEDISECDDEQIGAAVRKIHDDAREALQKYFQIQPVQNQQEGETVTLNQDFDSRQIRLTGKPAQNPPFTGTLLHKGWKATAVNLPTLSAAVDPTIIAPAEIELP